MHILETTTLNAANTVTATVVQGESSKTFYVILQSIQNYGTPDGKVLFESPSMFQAADAKRRIVKNSFTGFNTLNSEEVKAEATNFAADNL